ncbi:hypothetical protein [Thermococcus sp.]|uniref:hypothetical protein n=1 Tax=Thermococcus sp. TaxID=35749 RepID=UPI00262791A4|nr:hypothetical protein [Thermococcus sp.]
MELRPVFEVLEVFLLFLSAYWGLKVSMEALTYDRLKGILLLVPLIIALTFKEFGPLAAFLVMFAFFIVEGRGLLMSLTMGVLAYVVFLVGAIGSGIFLGLLGTYLHVPGYEIHGTLQELLHQAVMKR